MTAAAVMAVLWPLSRHYAVGRQADPDTQFYREQIAEIERDLARGVLLPSEAEAAKAEAGRRLLRATGMRGEGFAAVGEPALRRRRAASTLA
ncbi:MAG: c-type cytochrome biogenesis protein CcmI, partial [Pseudomonadota bacterium]|nr:c-type cytochrome biogenesis protein CcmI [Pseudomonadota bacterium]